MTTTELEGVILGIVSSRQPCSAYVVRQRFEQSPTWGWSKSKGAIYPAVARLVSRGSLAAEAAKQGRRNMELLSLTEVGRRELAEWIRAIGDEMGGAPVDPIRTRVNYLVFLPLEERRDFLDRAQSAAHKALMRTTLALADPHARDRWTLHATALGGLMQIRAKIDWLAAVREVALAPDPPGGADD